MPQLLFLSKKSKKSLLDFCKHYNIDLLDTNKSYYLKLEQKNYLNLSFEKHEDNVFSLCHSEVLNGDLMYDPLMYFFINKNSDQFYDIYPLSTTMSYSGFYKKYLFLNNSRNKIEKYSSVWLRDATSFANIWLQNIKEQEWYHKNNKNLKILTQEYI